MNLKKIFAGLFIFSAFFVTAQNKIIINADLGKETIDKNIYGHFSEHLGTCIYGGYWVGEDSKIPNTAGIRNDVVTALKEIGIPNLRWPGGCFADEYHWMDGIGPRSERPTMINTHWGGVTEDNSFGTHEFMELCNQLGAEPFVSGNLGSGTVQEMSQWVEYFNSSNISPMTDLRKANGQDEPWGVKYWGLGNETWGCGGNMTAQFYADVLRRYSTYTKNYGENRLFKVAVGPSGDDYEWTETLMKNGNPGRSFQGLSLHHYTVCNNWSVKGSATQFDEGDYITTMSKTLVMKELLEKHSTIMDKYDPQNRVALIVDEWGNWHDVEPGTNSGFLFQQNTVRDAMVASVNLDLFNNHARRVKMANIAQTVNVLQAMILTKDDQMVKTPSYYVFKMYTVHHDATLLPSDVTCDKYTYEDVTVPAISTSASKAADGKIHVTISNLDPNNSKAVTCELRGTPKVSFAKGSIVTGEKINSYNDFGKAEEVSLKNFSDVKVNGNVVTINMPAKSVVMIELN